MTEQLTISGQSDTKPDLTASIITPLDGKNVWEDFWAVWQTAKTGFSKGVDINGQTIVALTLEAKLEMEGRTASGNRLPDLYIYIETIDEDGEKVWTETLVMWKGKKDGYFTGKNEDGLDVVAQTKEAKISHAKRKPKQVKAIDLD